MSTGAHTQKGQTTRSRSQSTGGTPGQLRGQDFFFYSLFMPNETLWIWALVGLLVGCAGRRPQSTDALAKKLPATHWVATLPNGLRVVIQEDHRAPLVAVNVTYHVGSRDDPPGRSGFAHLFEHLMFEGSKHVPRGELDAILTKAGATVRNAGTSADRTTYYETLPSTQLETALFLESDRMGYLLESLDDTAFASARSVVKNEYWERVDSAPAGHARELVHRALFPKDHPYHRLTIGVPEDLDAATLTDVREFWLRYYSPNNATLVLVGDLDASRAMESVKKWFGSIPRGPDCPPWTRGDPPVLAEDRRLTLEASTSPGVDIAWIGPGFGGTDDAELTAAAGYLSGSIRARLMKDTKLADSVSLRREIGALATVYQLEITLSRSKDLDKALEQVDQGIANGSRFLRYAATGTDARTAIYGAYAATVFQLGPLSDRADAFALFDDVYGRSDAFVDRLRGFELIDEGRMTDAYQRYFLRAHRAVVVIHANGKAPIGGRLEP
jgi:predicted Zn-dependent peptidase